MTIKSILCIYSGAQGELTMLDSVFFLGKRHDAHICFLHLSTDPTDYMLGYREDAISMTPVIETIEKENQKRKKKAEKEIFSCAEKHQIPRDIKEESSNQLSVEFKHQTGMENGAITKEGRLSDLIVISHGQVKTGGLYEQAMISALFNTGRPILILPKQKSVFGQAPADVISLAWNGSLESARALQHSIPFMTEGKKVYLLTAVESNETSHLPNVQNALVTYLERHSINAEIVTVTRGSHSNLEEAVLAKAKELHTDLLAMGAYGHSRFREMILGGMTDYMLEKADIPLLLSH